VKEILPLLILAVLFVGMITFSRRGRERAAKAAASRRERLHPGSDVMTTSGLYGTVVSIDTADDSVQLAIAPGVEVKWTIAALRDVSELPGQYQAGQTPAGSTEHPANPNNPDNPSQN
jgi:preprotein translocase subunit YajC